VVTRLDSGDTGADVFDDACALVAEDDWLRHSEISRHDVEITVAYARSLHADTDFTRLRWAHLDLLNDQGFPGLIEDGGWGKDTL